MDREESLRAVLDGLERELRAEWERERREALLNEEGAVVSDQFMDAAVSLQERWDKLRLSGQVSEELEEVVKMTVGMGIAAAMREMAAKLRGADDKSLDGVI